MIDRKSQSLTMAGSWCSLNHAPDAAFGLGPDGPSAAHWLALLHPLIAESIAAAAHVGAIPAPATVAPHPGTLAYLDDGAPAVVAQYTDRSRIWIADSDSSAAADELFGTARGYQLGITPQTAVAIFTTNGTMLINPTAAVPTACAQEDGRWVPLITFEGLQDLPDATVELGEIPRCVTESEAADAANAEINRCSTAQANHGHHYKEHWT